MIELSHNTAASLLTESHVFCAGTVAQCLFRWKRLSEEQRPLAFMKVGRDGMSPTIFDGEQLAALAQKQELLEA